MFLIFNKGFRQFESILSDLSKKIQKSQVINEVETKTGEMYKLDTIDIVLDFPNSEERRITVKDKAGKEIITLDCHYEDNDELQRAKSDKFNSFLSFVRNNVSERQKHANKKVARFAAAAKQAEDTVKLKQEKAKQEKILSDAMERLRSL